MVRKGGFLDGFRREMLKAGADEFDGEQVALRLGRHLVADGRKFDSQIADVTQWSFNVEMELKTGAWWTVECLGANAYHFYPAHVQEDGTVVWMNVWLAGDMSLDETIARIGEEAFRAPAQSN